MSYVDPANGYGGPNTYGSPGTSTTDTSGNTLKPISAQVKPTGTDTSGSNSSEEWAQWLSLINGIANSQKKPSFVQPPWAPEQKGLFDYAMQRVINLPHTGEALAPYAMARAGENNPIDINALKAGKVGYTPTGGANQADLVKNMVPPGGGGSPIPSTPPPGGPGTPSPGSPGAGAGGSSPDPFAGLPDTSAGGNTGAGGNFNASDVLQKGIDYINQHGGSGKAAGMTAGAIAAYLGMPGLIATGLGKVISWLWDRYAKGEMSAQDIANFVAKGNEAGIAGVGGGANPRTPVQNPGNTMFDPMGFGDQSRFNTGLATDPGQIGSNTQQGGDKGFGYGMDYNDTGHHVLPGGPRSGGGGGLV